MATLSETDLLRIHRGLMRYWSNIWQQVGGSKAELLATVEETDSWIDDNTASYVSVLTYGSNYNAAQKTLIFCAVAAMRVSAVFARMLLGEVD